MPIDEIFLDEKEPFLGAVVQNIEVEKARKEIFEMYNSYVQRLEEFNKKFPALAKMVEHRVQHISDFISRGKFVKYLLSTDLGVENSENFIKMLTEQLKITYNSATLDEQKEIFDRIEVLRQEEEKAAERERKALGSTQIPANGLDAGHEEMKTSEQINPKVLKLMELGFVKKDKLPAPVAPEVARFETFQHWICALTPSQRNDFNRWCLRTQNRTEMNTLIETVQSKIKKSQQRDILDLFKKEQDAVFKYYASRIIKKLVKEEFETWQKDIYAKKIEELSRKIRLGEIDKSSTEAIKKEIDSLFILVNKHLQKLITHFNTDDQTPVYQSHENESWFDESQNNKYLTWQTELFKGDPEDDINDITRFVLNPGTVDDPSVELEKKFKEQRYRFTLTPDPKESDLKEMSVLFNGTFTELKTKLLAQYGVTLGKKEAQAQEILEESASSKSPIHRVEYDSSRHSEFTPDILEEGKLPTASKALTKIIGGFTDTKGKKIPGSYKLESDTRMTLLTSDQIELITKAHGVNDAILRDFQQKHWVASGAKFLIPLSAYGTEGLYVWFNVIAIKQALEMVTTIVGSSFNEGYEIDPTTQSFINGINYFLLPFITLAQVTYNPWKLRDDLDLNSMMNNTTLWSMLTPRNALMLTSALTTFLAGGATDLLPLVGKKGLESAASFWTVGGIVLFLSVAYYFAFNAKSILGNNTEKGLKSLYDTLCRLLDEDPQVKAVAKVEGFHKISSMLERTLRLASVPAALGDMLNWSKGMIDASTYSVAATTFISTLSIRAFKIEDYYNPEKTRSSQYTEEKWIEATNQFNQQMKEHPLWTRLSLEMNESLFIKLGIGGYIIPKFISETLVPDSSRAVAMLAMSAILILSLSSMFYESAKKIDIKNRVKTNDLSFNFLATLAFACCVADAFSRIVNILYTGEFYAPPGTFDPRTENGRLAIEFLVCLEAYLNLGSFLFQVGENQETLKSLSADFFDSTCGECLDKHALIRFEDGIAWAMKKGLEQFKKAGDLCAASSSLSGSRPLLSGVVKSRHALSGSGTEMQNVAKGYSGEVPLSYATDAVSDTPYQRMKS